MNIDYIAGFFDGEGSIIIQGNKVTLSIPQTNEKILIEIRDYFGIGNVYPLKKRKEHWKDAWCYKCNGNNKCLKVLEELEPYLILKRSKAKQAILLLEKARIKEINRISRNIDAINLVIEQKLSYRQVEKITGISRQVLCNEMKKIRSTGEKVSQLSV